MPNTVPSTALVRNIFRTFRVINQDRNLSRKNREEVKTLYLQRVLTRVASALPKRDDRKQPPASLAARPERGLLNAVQVEALTGIDRKTLWGYATNGTIPHVRIESNVRFR